MSTRTKAIWMLYSLSIAASTVSAWLRHPAHPVAAAVEVIANGLLFAAIGLLLTVFVQWAGK